MTNEVMKVERLGYLNFQPYERSNDRVDYAKRLQRAQHYNRPVFQSVDL